MANYFMSYVGHITGTKIETDMRRDIFSHLTKLSFNYFDNTKIGQIMSRVTTDLFDNGICPSLPRGSFYCDNQDYGFLYNS